MNLRNWKIRNARARKKAKPILHHMKTWKKKENQHNDTNEPSKSISKGERLRIFTEYPRTLKFLECPRITFFFKVAKNTLEIDNFVENHWILIKILEKVKYVLEIWQQWQCATYSLSNKYIACAYVQWSECSRQQSVLGVIKPGM